MGKALAKRSKRATRSKAAKTRTARSRTSSTSRSSAGGIRTVRNALAWLDGLVNYERMLRVGYNQANFNLSRMLRILGALGNPHRGLVCVHVAGTKGKGSTCHMLAAMLEHAGYQTGLYTSPHLINVRERIRVNSRLISENDFAGVIGKVAAAARRLGEKDTPTYFEALTAAALLHFSNIGVDIAVLETGLGGRLDATNVCKPEVCGITSISYDHMQQLGSTLEAIAEEKAGIFKPGVPVVSAPQAPGVERVLRQAAERVGTQIRIVGEDIEYSYRFESSRATGPRSRVCMTTGTSRFDHVHVPLLGEHQAYNCGVALGMIDVLRSRGFDLPEQTAVDGLARTRSEGRLEIVRDHPRTIVDTAHNASSVAALMRAIGQNITYDSMVVIFACSADKDIDGMLTQLQLGADKVIFTNNGTTRSADPKELLARFLEKTQKMAQVEPTLLDAYRTACNCVTRDDLICITGSNYLVGLAKQQIPSLPL